MMFMQDVYKWLYKSLFHTPVLLSQVYWAVVILAWCNIPEEFSHYMFHIYTVCSHCDIFYILMLQVICGL